MADPDSEAIPHWTSSPYGIHPSTLDSLDHCPSHRSRNSSHSSQYYSKASTDEEQEWYCCTVLCYSSIPLTIRQRRRITSQVLSEAACDGIRIRWQRRPVLDLPAAIEKAREKHRMLRAGPEYLALLPRYVCQADLEMYTYLVCVTGKGLVEVKGSEARREEYLWTGFTLEDGEWALKTGPNLEAGSERSRVPSGEEQDARGVTDTT